MIPVAIPHSHTKIGRYYAVAESGGAWGVYQIDEDSLLKQDPYTPLLGELLATFPADDHRQRSRAFEYAEFLSGGTNRSIEAKFSAILNILTNFRTQMDANVQAIISGEATLASQLGTIATGVNTLVGDVSDLQQKLTAALANPNTEPADLQAIATGLQTALDAAAPITQALATALPAPTPAPADTGTPATDTGTTQPAPTDSGATGTDVTGTQSGS